MKENRTKQIGRAARAWAWWRGLVGLDCFAQRASVSFKDGLTLAGSSVGLWLSSDTSGAVGTDTGSKGDLAFPANPREAVLT